MCCSFTCVSCMWLVVATDPTAGRVCDCTTIVRKIVRGQRTVQILRANLKKTHISRENVVAIPQDDGTLLIGLSGGSCSRIRQNAGQTMSAAADDTFRRCKKMGLSRKLLMPAVY